MAEAVKGGSGGSGGLQGGRSGEGLQRQEGAGVKEGTVSLVGAGCGDPALLTVKAQNSLKDCEVLIYDSLVSERLLEQAPAACEKIYVGKRYGRHAMKQEEISALLIQKAQEGKRVVRLKGGDPYVFGRGGEEFLALLEAGIFCEEIPGITSCIAVPAAAGIPVTHRGMSRSFTVITGTTAQEDGREGLQMDFETLAKLEGTLVILMGVHHLKEIAEGLMEAGKAPDTPCAAIMEGTTAEQRCVRAPLDEIAERTLAAGILPPAVIVIGAVAQLELVSGRRSGAVSISGGVAGHQAGKHSGDGEPPAGERDGSEEPQIGERDGSEERRGGSVELQVGQRSAALPENAPLSGISIGVTGTLHFVEKLSAVLRGLGAAVCGMDFLEVRETAAALPDFREYGWLVFTSPNGARIFLEKMKREKRDLRSLADSRIAVIGPGTAQVLEEAGIFPDFMPSAYDAEHLAEGLTARLLEDGVSVFERKPALFLRAARGSASLPRIFTEKGLAFAEFPLYGIGVEEEKRRLARQETPDYLVFGAGSGVRAYFDGIGKEESAFFAERRVRYVCMGEACGRELARFVQEEFLVAEESSAAGIAACICRDAAGLWNVRSGEK